VLAQTPRPRSATRRVALLAFLVAAATGCNSDFASNAKNIPSPDELADTLRCGWIHKQDETLTASDSCWLVTPQPGLSVMPQGAGACDAESGQRPSIWHGGDTVALWATTKEMGNVRADSAAIACP
jgi:hypothetical protein